MRIFDWMYAIMVFGINEYMTLTHNGINIAVEIEAQSMGIWWCQWSLPWNDWYFSNKFGVFSRTWGFNHPTLEFDIQKTASRWETINDLYPNVVYVMSNDVKLFWHRGMGTSNQPFDEVNLKSRLLRRSGLVYLIGDFFMGYVANFKGILCLKGFWGSV